MIKENTLFDKHNVYSVCVYKYLFSTPPEPIFEAVLSKSYPVED